MPVENPAPTAAGAQETEPYLRGVLRDLVAEFWTRGSRLPEVPTRKLPADTVAAARVPAGVHLAFTGTATAVDLAVQVGERTSVPAPTLAEVFLARAGATVTTVPVAPGTLRVPLPARAPDDVVRLYLPEQVTVRVPTITPVGGEIAPAPRGPLWVVHGDSISQGWSVTQAGLGWPSRVGEQLGLDVVNLGFAGSARGELLAADVVGASGAAAVALAWGTNAWSSLPTDAAAVAETARLFLTALRQGLPDAPVVVLSPIVRPDAERTANRFGTTHVELRRAIEAAVTAFGDPRVTLVPGRDLVPVDELADGLHPDDAGQATLAAALAPHVAAGLGLAAAR